MGKHQKSAQKHKHRQQKDVSDESDNNFDIDEVDDENDTYDESGSYSGEEEEYSEEEYSEEEHNRKAQSKKKSKSRNKKHHRDDEDDNDIDEEIKPKQLKLNEKTKEHLKRKINDWLDSDDKIKILNARLKKYKDEKKAQEEFIIKVITKLGMEESKIDIHDNHNQLRSRVYRYKSETKGAIKENIIKDALMELIRDEKTVNQLVKKIDSRRPVIERYYLKRTKGNNEK